MATDKIRDEPRIGKIVVVRWRMQRGDPKDKSSGNL